MTAPFPFDERIKLAAMLLVRTRIFYDLWWLYEGRETRPRILDVMNQYPDFFRFDAHAHLVALVIYLAALFETRRDTINLGALINSSQSYIENGAQQKAKVLLAEARPVSSRLKVLRDNVFAHRSASFSHKDAFSAAGIAPDRLRDLIDSALQISNILLAARGLRTETFFDLARTDAHALLNDLAKIHTLPQPAS